MKGAGAKIAEVVRDRHIMESWRGWGSDLALQLLHQQSSVINDGMQSRVDDYLLRRQPNSVAGSWYRDLI